MRASSYVTTIVAAVISAFACGVVAQYGAPIDTALPLIAVIITIVAAISTPALQLAVPLLMGGEILIADERVRLLWFGLVIGLVFATALFRVDGFFRAAFLAIGAIVLLRWIPMSNVVIWREALLMALALLIVAALQPSRLSVPVAVAVALFTPMFPLRTIWFPIAVLIVIVWAEAYRLRAEAVASLAMAVMLLFFAWSGVLARAPLLALRGFPSSTPRSPLRMALAPGESISLDVPEDAGGLIISGANVARLPVGTAVGEIDRVPIRIGDVADWGFLRRDHHYGSRNAVPVHAAGELREYGQAAWIDGAARFPLARGVKSVRVTADPRLPPDARLQLDAWELGKR
jgi:hypothetical protein